ncbi:Putative receptor protein kinase ZmPK1 [Linum perenne]
MDDYSSKLPNLLPFLVLLLLSSSVFVTSTKEKKKLFSISPHSQNDIVSPNRIFAAGFFPVGDNAFTFSVWFIDDENATVVWSANRDTPVNGKYSELAVQSSGNLVLTDAGRTVVWETKTTSFSSPRLLLLDSGNLVLRNSNGVILWQSFDFPTDTLLPNQPLTKEGRLVSSRSLTNRSSGYFKFYFDNDNVLRLLYADPDVSSVYWPDPELMSWEAGRSTYNSTRIALLDSLGNFNSTDGYSFSSSDYGVGVDIQRRITLDFDGNVRLYSRRRGQYGPWKITYQAMSQSCRIHGSCGPNSLCNYVPGLGRKCSCIPGYRAADETDWSLGCVREFNIPCNKSNEIEFIKLTNVEFYGYDFAFHPNYTLEQCKNVCLSRCDCLGFQFNMPYCFAKTMLLNGRHSSDFQGDLYLKVAKGVNSSYKPLESFNLKCPEGAVKRVELERKYVRGKENGSLRFVLWFAVAMGGIEFVCIWLVWYYLMSKSWHGYSSLEDQHAAFGFRKFTYAELKKATRGFKDEIGRGCGGTVYKGILSDQRVAAIKKLNEYADEQGEEEFRAEVNTVGKLNHMNLTEMWGYCSEGKHKMLVYEYVEHGSLEKNMMSRTLSWEKRFKIAVGTARGLAYLHEECLEWVLHCDVKPGNILVDKEYNGKVSDFGLSQAMKRGGGEVTRRVRGTRGYMAPEWVLNQPITAKVDVYSYGMVVLEMVTGRSPVGTEEWVRERVKESPEDWVEEVVDEKLGGKYERKEVEVLVAVALKCVEVDKDSRPTMRRVVQDLLLHAHQP